MLIYKVFAKSDYDFFAATGKSKGSVIDLRDGFIHFSTRDQLSETINKNFYGYELLYILVFSEKDLFPNLKWELSRNSRLFPHYYGHLFFSKVIYNICLK